MKERVQREGKDEGGREEEKEGRKWGNGGVPRALCPPSPKTGM